MDTDADLEPLVRRSYLIFFRDGLWDICLGLFVLGWGIGLLADMYYLGGTLFIALWFLVLGIKKWITYPRIGYVKLGKGETKAKARLAVLLGVIALAGVAAFLFVAMDSRPQWLRDYIPLFFNIMLALPVGAIAWWVGVRVFYLYSFLIFAGGAVYTWADIEWSHTFIVAGGLITIIGIGILINFLSRYHRNTEGGNNATP
jgi:hypothetical protein